MMRRSCGDDDEALALEAADDLGDEATFDGVGLADDEGAIHGSVRLVRPRHDDKN